MIFLWFVDLPPRHRFVNHLFALAGERHDHMTLGLNAWNSRYLPPAKPGAEERYAELFFTLPNDSYIELLGDLYHKNLYATYGAKPHLAKEIASFRAGASAR